MRWALLAFVLPIVSALEWTRASEYSPLGGSSLIARATLDVCATIDIDVPLDVTTCVPNTVPGLPQVCTTVSTPIRIAEDICLCLAGGVLTPESLVRIDAVLNSGSGPVGRLVAALGQAVLRSRVLSIVTSLLGAQPAPNCSYPTGAIPRCDAVDPCAYDCPAGTSLCGTVCTASTCVSGVPQPDRRRALAGAITDAICPIGLSACAIPSSALDARKGFECVDTQSDLESCGACAFPLPGQPLGQDCSQIPNASEVLCSSGSCVVRSCKKGFEVNAAGTGCVSLTGALESAEEILGEALWVQQKVSGATVRARKEAMRKRQANAGKLRSSKRAL